MVNWSLTMTAHNKGFMLIEVLITLFIIGLILTAFIKSTTENARTLSILKDKTVAQWVASNVFHDAELGFISPSSSSGNTVTGTTQMANQSWYWKITFKKMPTPNAWETNIDVKKGSFKTQSILHWKAYFLTKPKTRSTR
jgi:general secretion pathway protein I